METTFTYNNKESLQIVYSHYSDFLLKTLYIIDNLKYFCLKKNKFKKAKQETKY